MTPTLAEVITALERAYPPALAESWDAIGLVCGDRAEPVRSVLVCVDPVESTVDEALELGADLVLAHHPLLLRGVHGVPADDPKGRLVHRLVRAGAALYCAHTNADSADPGVSDALADALGLTNTGPLDPKPEEPRDVLSVFVPVADAARVLDAVTAAGAGRFEGYSHGAWSVDGTGQFRPLEGSNPTVGTVGELHREAETRVETVLPRSRRAAVIEALRAAHPYEVPAFDLHEMAALPSAKGLGRVGELPEPEPFAEFVRHVARSLPATAWGVRGAGDPERMIKRVAVCGGAGDSLLGAATRSGADAYVTADLRHHPAGEHLEKGAHLPALVDVAHWASEWPWCEQAAGVIRAAFGGNVAVHVSKRRTDPWTISAS